MLQMGTLARFVHYLHDDSSNKQQESCQVEGKTSANEQQWFGLLSVKSANLDVPLCSFSQQAQATGSSCSGACSATIAVNWRERIIVVLVPSVWYGDCQHIYKVSKPWLVIFLLVDTMCRRRKRSASHVIFILCRIPKQLGLVLFMKTWPAFLLYSCHGGGQR